MHLCLKALEFHPVNSWRSCLCPVILEEVLHDSSCLLIEILSRGCTACSESVPGPSLAPFCVSDTFVAEPMSPEAERGVSCVMMMFLGQIRSEPHLVQVSVDSIQAKNKPLKCFHCVSPLPSATDLRCSNNFKRKKQCLSLTTECACTACLCEHHHCTSSAFPDPFPVTSLPCLSATCPLLCLRIPGVDPGWVGGSVTDSLNLQVRQDLGETFTLCHCWDWLPPPSSGDLFSVCGCFLTGTRPWKLTEADDLHQNHHKQC